jgi:hypothetical protein
MLSLDIDINVNTITGVGKQGERGEAKIRSRQARLNAADERSKIDRSVKRRRGGEPSTNCFTFSFTYL